MILAVNSLDEGFGASAVVVDTEVYLHGRLRAATEEVASMGDITQVHGLE
ncbi:hypothetical protein MYX78_03490 [Acidobacteria bacterium AH-259-G07]|nr:hypothetical protein [Acidobacteria bacterium AH-259-G07]